MIDFQSFPDALTTDLGAFSPLEGALTEGMSEAAKTLWSSADGRVELGLWACTAGQFELEMEGGSEFCHFLQGRLRVVQPDGRHTEYGPGDALMMPLGWRGRWEVLEPIRKIYMYDYKQA
ncbi:cupin domain-containing protein (plasmid) [Thioclava sp. GXIMD4216]